MEAIKCLLDSMVVETETLQIHWTIPQNAIWYNWLNARDSWKEHCITEHVCHHTFIELNAVSCNTLVVQRTGGSRATSFLGSHFFPHTGVWESCSGNGKKNDPGNGLVLDHSFKPVTFYCKGRTQFGINYLYVWNKLSLLEFLPKQKAQLIECKS